MPLSAEMCASAEIFFGHPPSLALITVTFGVNASMALANATPDSLEVPVNSHLQALFKFHPLADPQEALDVPKAFMFMELVFTTPHASSEKLTRPLSSSAPLSLLALFHRNPLQKERFNLN